MASAKFKETEKQRQAAFKQTSAYFSQGAKADGLYKNLPRAFCLPTTHTAENLFAQIRQPAISYFASHAIQWHNGIGQSPSNHLCDSQVSCVNLLFPFADKPDALAALLKPVFPTLKRVLPIDSRSGEYITFEWIGAENYLKERVGRGGKRTRGANCTSADAAVKIEHQDGTTQFVLIEWKYTEAYSPASYKRSASGTDRTTIYRHLYERDDFPLDKTRLPNFDALFFEPFYQFFRQQCLAHEMERAHELGADMVSLLHIAPAGNRDFTRVTSPLLQPLGTSVTAVWKTLMRQPDRFTSISTEALFGHFPIAQFPELHDWWAYITTRYTWLQTI